MSDSSEEAQQKLAALEAKYADDLTRSERCVLNVDCASVSRNALCNKKPTYYR